MENNFIRIGDDYFKVVIHTDKNGDSHPGELAYRKRQTILDDYGKDFLKKIPRYDAAVNVPCNKGEPRIYETDYNLYHPFQHKPMKGEWTWTELMIRHVFAEQYELGLDYIQLLYERPTQQLPILCLVSRENATGKTTFINWLSTLFYGNVAIIGNQDLHGQFNGHYISRLIIAVDESRIDKLSSLEKLKAMATQERAFINAKYQNQRPIDFIGKIILSSNYEDSFITARDEDIRFWVRRLNKPDHINYDIDQALKDEIPAFIHFLDHRTPSTQKRSRMWFEAKDIETTALTAIRENSKSWLYKELRERFDDLFIELNFGTDGRDRNDNPFFLATPTDIKNKWFVNDHQATVSYIRKVLKDEFKLVPSEKTIRYRPFAAEFIPDNTGTPFTISRKQNGSPIAEQTSEGKESEVECEIEMPF